MNDETDDAIEALLRANFEGPVAADDFCDAVMQRLPVRRNRHNWPLAIGVLTGVVLCALSLRSAPLAATGWIDWQTGNLSSSVIALVVTMAGMALLAMAWAISEAVQPESLRANRMRG